MGKLEIEYPLVICYIAIVNGAQKQFIYLLKMVNFHSYVSLPEGTYVHDMYYTQPCMSTYRWQILVLCTRYFDVYVYTVHDIHEIYMVLAQHNPKNNWLFTYNQSWIMMMLRTLMMSIVLVISCNTMEEFLNQLIGGIHPIIDRDSTIPNRWCRISSLFATSTVSY